MLAVHKTGKVFNGMEFKVALGNTWKENLAELSGGQRLVNFVGVLKFVLFHCSCVYS